MLVAGQKPRFVLVSWHPLWDCGSGRAKISLHAVKPHWLGRCLADTKFARKALNFKPERDGTEMKSQRNSRWLHYLSESEFWGGIEAVVRERTLSPEMRLELQRWLLCLCLLKDIFILCNALLSSPPCCVIWVHEHVFNLTLTLVW